MQVLENKKNMLLNREELVATIQSEKTPSKIEILKIIANQLKKHEDQIVVEKIEGNFGNHEFLIKAKIYDDVKTKDKYEVVPRKVKKKRAEEAKKLEDEKKKKADEDAKLKEQSKSEEAKNE